MGNQNDTKWRAHDKNVPHPGDSCSTNNDDFNDADQLTDIDQSSSEVIFIRDSCDITVETTDTQVAVSLQAALQVAIAIAKSTDSTIKPSKARNN